MVGPWVVRSEVLPESSGPPETVLAKKAVISMEAFMDGKVEYVVAAPTQKEKATGGFVPKPLIFRHFSKVDRPKAWKNCDLRVQTTLPVLGTDVPARYGVYGPEEVGVEETIGPECLIRVSIVLSDREGDELN